MTSLYTVAPPGCGPLYPVEDLHRALANARRHGPGTRVWRHPEGLVLVEVVDADADEQLVEALARHLELVNVGIGGWLGEAECAS